VNDYLLIRCDGGGKSEISFLRPLRSASLLRFFPLLSRNLSRLRSRHSLRRSLLRHLHTVRSLKRQHFIHQRHAVRTRVSVNLLAIREKDERRDFRHLQSLGQRLGLFVLVRDQSRPSRRTRSVSGKRNDRREDLQASARRIVLDRNVDNRELLGDSISTGAMKPGTSCAGMHNSKKSFKSASVEMSVKKS